jgi:hypothetical protein
MKTFEVMEMKAIASSRRLIQCTSIACAVALTSLAPSDLLARQTGAAQQPAKKEVVRVVAPSTGAPKKFETPQQAADALVKAASDFNITSLIQIFGSGGSDVVFSGEFAQDRQNASDFAARAKEKMNVSVDPKNARRAFLNVGSEDWPFPVPLVKSGATWSFDAVAGRRNCIIAVSAQRSRRHPDLPGLR